MDEKINERGRDDAKAETQAEKKHAKITKRGLRVLTCQ